MSNSIFDLPLGYRRDATSSGNAFMYHNNIERILNGSVTGITSREDIINPEQLLNIDMYQRTARGKALYDEHLGALRNVQAQQQASYDEWFNSEEQQAIRQREAGLNPNLIGIEPSSTQSPDVSQASPVEGMPTIGEQTLQGVSVAASLGSMVASGISACSQLAALPASIASSYASAGAASAAADLSKAQTDAFNIANVENFEKLVSADVAARLADATSAFVANSANAGQQFDFAGWFADPKNSDGLIESYAPSDSPMYRHALSRVMNKHQQAIAKSYDVYGNRLKGQSSVAQMLASPYYDENLVLQVAIMEPLYNAYKEKELIALDYETKLHQWELEKLEGLDRDLYLQNLNDDLRKRVAENKYYTDYFNNFDGDEAALHDMMIKQSDAIDKRVRSNIASSLEEIYIDRPNSYLGQRSLSLLLGGANLAWDDYLALLGSEKINSVLNNFGSSSIFNGSLGLNPLNLNFNRFSGYQNTDGRYIPGQMSVFE